ncbi:hypothetical protein [Brevibacillus sp. MCWH]|jgi:hypothetical protein|uniref:hypothetical protein n=1 Tax=Brevibacillus sp. MCWH TaxID=2508871 RepID=UPI001490CD7D|nr:hypothetical protein [Brevibacillus sp. MCWH]NNV01654.1 hypothetical protein [Brevibacillus sp. MCWH]
MKKLFKTDEENQEYLKWYQLELDKKCDELVEKVKQLNKELIEMMREKGFTENEINRVLYKNDLEPLYKHGYMQRLH